MLFWLRFGNTRNPVLAPAASSSSLVWTLSFKTVRTQYARTECGREKNCTTPAWHPTGNNVPFPRPSSRAARVCVCPLRGFITYVQYNMEMIPVQGSPFAVCDPESIYIFREKDNIVWYYCIILSCVCTLLC